MKSIKIFPVLTLIFFLSTIWLLYQKFQTPPSKPSTEIKVTPRPPVAEKEEIGDDSNLSEEDLVELQRLRGLENEVVSAGAGSAPSAGSAASVSLEAVWEALSFRKSPPSPLFEPLA